MYRTALCFVSCFAKESAYVWIRRILTVIRIRDRIRPKARLARTPELRAARDLHLELLAAPMVRLVVVPLPRRQLQPPRSRSQLIDSC